MDWIQRRDDQLTACLDQIANDAKAGKAELIASMRVVVELIKLDGALPDK